MNASLKKSTDEKVYKVCLLGCSLDTGNRGVSALTASLVKIIKIMNNKSEIYLLIGNRSSSPQKLSISGATMILNVVNYRLSFRSPIKVHLFYIFFLACISKLTPIRAIRRRIIKSNKWLETAFTADLVGDIRGGDSFSDIYGFGRFFIGSLPRIIAILLKKEIILLPQTYGPYKNIITRFIAKYIMKNSKIIMSRDVQSIEIVKQILHKRNTEKIVFCPDVAFVLDPIVPDNIELYPNKYEFNEIPMIGLNINGLMYNGGYSKKNMFGLKLCYKEFIQELLLTLLRKTEACILLVPHTFGERGNINSDPDACREIYSSINGKDRIFIINREYDQNEIKGIISLCDFFIGSRMHSCIAALSQGIPTVGIAYSNKFFGVFNSIALENLIIDARLMDSKESIKKIVDFYNEHKNDSPGVRESNIMKINILKNKIIEIFRTVMKYEMNSKE